MLFIIGILLLGFMSDNILADVPQDLANHFVEQSQEKSKAYLSEAEGLKEKSEIEMKAALAENPKGCSFTCLKSEQSTKFEDNTAKAEESRKTFIFISLSMPRNSLRSLFLEAERQKAVLVLRGLKKNSFKETVDTLKVLNISAIIDPNLFDTHNIKTVPTFVYLKATETLTLKGNVSLSYALQKFKGDS